MKLTRLLAAPGKLEAPPRAPAGLEPGAPPRSLSAVFDALLGKAMLCVYCVKREATTDDHVVPRGFFDEPPNGGYIKVPACYPCNNKVYSRDEEASSTSAGS